MSVHEGFVFDQVKKCNDGEKDIQI